MGSSYNANLPRCVWNRRTCTMAQKCLDAGVSMISLDWILSVKKMQKAFCMKIISTWPQKWGGGGGQNLMTGDRKRKEQGKGRPTHWNSGEVGVKRRDFYLNQK